VRRGIRERLEFIDFRLFWEGRINRSDIIDQFDISIPQASKDLSDYDTAAPGNLIYDASAKRYFAAATFKPHFITPNADYYLLQLRNIADHTVPVEQTLLSAIPAAESMPIPLRRVNVHALRAVLRAIERKRAINIFYQSMNEARPAAVWRWIVPHALAHDGLRWHVRAFCVETAKFKDFVLPRFLDAGEERDTDVQSTDDRPWNEYFSVVLVPNPALSAQQQRVIADDYCMEYRQISIRLRKAMIYYFEKRLRLDVADVMDDPKETPVVVLNKEAFFEVICELDPSSVKRRARLQRVNILPG